jgi:hypothetical protein
MNSSTNNGKGVPHSAERPLSFCRDLSQEIRADEAPDREQRKEHDPADTVELQSAPTGEILGPRIHDISEESADQQKHDPQKDEQDFQKDPHGRII